MPKTHNEHVGSASSSIAEEKWAKPRYQEGGLRQEPNPLHPWLPWRSNRHQSVVLSPASFGWIRSREGVVMETQFTTETKSRKGVLVQDHLICQCKCRKTSIQKILQMHSEWVRHRSTETFITRTVPKFPSACNERVTRKITNCLFIWASRKQKKGGSPSS